MTTALHCTSHTNNAKEILPDINVRRTDNQATDMHFADMVFLSLDSFSLCLSFIMHTRICGFPILSVLMVETHFQMMQVICCLENHLLNVLPVAHMYLQ